MRALILFVTCVLWAVPSLAEDAPFEPQGQPNQAKVPNEPLSETEQSISKCRLAIEDYYADKIAELRLRTVAAIKRLEVAEKPKPHWAGFDEWAQFAETVLEINGAEGETYGLFEAGTETGPKRLAVALSRIAGRKSEILAHFEWEAGKLERQKRHALAAGLWPVEPAKRPQEGEPEAKPKEMRGLVTGILYSRQDPTALIDGKIVRQTAVIHGVKILKIHRDKVEFAKDGRTWSQQVQEAPKAYWE